MRLPLERRCKCGVQVDCKCMEFVTSGSYKRKWLRVDRTIRDLTCGDLEIPLLVIRLGVTEPKNSEFVWLIDLLEGRGKKGGGGI